MTEDNPGVLGGFTPGARIASYRLEEQIGQGGMAVVFRAHDERLDRTVALKILSPALAADEAFRQRFIRESRAAAAVDDPHIIPVFEAGEASGVLFIAMRYVRGGDVRSMLKEFGPLPPGRVAEIVSQVGSALDAAHNRGLVHRDVKPANILLDARPGMGRPDHVYLSDFGLSKGSLQATGLTGTGMFLGTLDYIAPEQIEGRPVDGRADEYALACAAYELITGVPPFQRDDAMAVMYAQLTEPAPPATSRRPGLPGAVDHVFARALSKPVDERYPNCVEFAEALRSALGLRPYDSGPSSIPSLPHPRTQLADPVEPADATVVPGGRPGSGQPATGPGGQPAAGPGSQPTQVGARRDTSPDLTAAYSEPDVGGYRRPWYRSPVALGAAILVLLGAGGGGSYLALHHNSKKEKHGGAIPLAVPGCTRNVGRAPTLKVPNRLTGVQGGDPFGVGVTKDGKFVFAMTPTTLNVLVKGRGLKLTQSHAYHVATARAMMNNGVLTNDGKYLVVAAGSGLDIFNLAKAEGGIMPLVGILSVPGLSGSGVAVEVVLSPDSQFAFVTLRTRDIMAVFNLRKALADRAFGSSAYIGSVRLGSMPVGITSSPDGKYLYVTSYSTTDAIGTGPGLLSVLDVAKAETNPRASVIAQIKAGCNPARVITSQDGQTVWVTARGSNALLAFSAARLLAHSQHPLIAKVAVGQTPIGLTLVNNGTTMVVADTDIQNTGTHNLAVVNVAAALRGKRALVGFIATGQMPREFAVVQGGRYLLVTDNASGQVQVIDVSKLP